MRLGSERVGARGLMVLGAAGVLGLGLAVHGYSRVKARWNFRPPAPQRVDDLGLPLGWTSVCRPFRTASRHEPTGGFS